MKKTLLILFTLLIGLSSHAQELDTVYTDLEKAIKNKDKVIVLDLSSQDLTEIPIEIKEFPNMRFLDVSDNNISSIPDFLAECNNLEALILGKFAWKFDGIKGNPISSLPESLNNCPSLSCVSLIGCQFTELPKFVRNKYANGKKMLVIWSSKELENKEDIKMLKKDYIKQGKKTTPSGKWNYYLSAKIWVSDHFWYFE